MSLSLRKLTICLRYMIPFPSYCCYGRFLLTIIHFSHCTHETMHSYCSVFGLIHIPFFQSFRLQYMLKCNAFYIWTAAAPDAAVVLLFLLHVVFFFSYFDERARDRFPFRPSLPFAFWRNIRMFGMMRCVHICIYTNTHTIDGMHPNEKQNFNYSH